MNADRANKDPDELVAAFVAAFDAVELDGHDTERSSLAVDCWRPRQHAGREWHLAGSDRWQCGACHRPAAGLSIVGAVDSPPLTAEAILDTYGDRP